MTTHSWGFRHEQDSFLQHSQIEKQKTLMFRKTSSRVQITKTCILEITFELARKAGPMLLSVSMALESLREQVVAVDSQADKLVAERAIRDSLIVDAIDAGVTYRVVGRITGLSRDRLNTIVNSHRKAARNAQQD